MMPEGPQLALKPEQERARKRLQQRREASAAQALQEARASQQAGKAVAQVQDMSWLEEEEKVEARARAKAEAKAAAKKPKKKKGKGSGATGLEQETIVEGEREDEVEELEEAVDEGEAQEDDLALAVPPNVAGDEVEDLDVVAYNEQEFKLLEKASNKSSRRKAKQQEHALKSKDLNEAEEATQFSAEAQGSKPSKAIKEGGAGSSDQCSQGSHEPEQEPPVPRAGDSEAESSGEQLAPAHQEAATAGESDTGSAWAVSKGKTLAADAPEFVPFSANPFSVTVPQDKEAAGGQVTGMEEQIQFPQGIAITTVVISGIREYHTPDSFRELLDTWGLLGTYDFFYMPTDHMCVGYAFVNFIDPTFAQFCQWLFQQYQVEGTATPFNVQGLENNIAHWSHNAVDGMTNAPLIIQSPSPSQWAVNGVNMMLNSKFSPQIREQFHKTKMCVFQKKNKCALGSTCPFAHSKVELTSAPDLAKTKLCYNFFRRKCNDPRCKFAHGYSELRATDGIYKTELCRWWSYGTCKAGDACRYAHGAEELRVQPGMDMSMDMSMMGMGYMSMPESYAEYGMNEVSQVSGMVQEASPSVAPGSWNRQASAVSSGFCRQESEGISDMGLSDISTFIGGVESSMPKRQQTAPPTLALKSFTSLTELRRKAMLPAESGLSSDTVVLRARGTFIEFVQLDDELNPAPSPMRRSWSDGDLPQLMEVMENMDDLEEEF